MESDLDWPSESLALAWSTVAFVEVLIIDRHHCQTDQDQRAHPRVPCHCQMAIFGTGLMSAGGSIELEYTITLNRPAVHLKFFPLEVLVHWQSDKTRSQLSGKSPAGTSPGQVRSGLLLGRGPGPCQRQVHRA